MKIDPVKIDLLMAERKITITELSRISGLSQQGISAIKLRRTCTPVSAGKIAEGLGVPVRSIIDTSDVGSAPISEDKTGDQP